MRLLRRAACGIAVAMIGAGCTIPRTSFATADSIPSANHRNADLLYVSDWSKGKIWILTYPAGTPVTSIADDRSPFGLCSDRDGDVFVTDYGATTKQIVEYAHGATAPQMRYDDPNQAPRGCDVDPTTGNLAVVNGGRGGNVVVYERPSGTTQSYAVGLLYPFACAYDPSGDLFVDGYHVASGDKFALAELRHGASAFERIRVEGSVGLPGHIAWDGLNLAVGDFGSPGLIYQLRPLPHAAAVKLVGTVTLTGPLRQPPEGVEFWIGDGALLMPFGTNHNINRLGYWGYPAGGPYVRAVDAFANGSLYGVTVSALPVH